MQLSRIAAEWISALERLKSRWQQRFFFFDFFFRSLNRGKRRVRPQHVLLTTQLPRVSVEPFESVNWVAYFPFDGGLGLRLDRSVRVTTPRRRRRRRRVSLLPRQPLSSTAP